MKILAHLIILLLLTSTVAAYSYLDNNKGYPAANRVYRMNEQYDNHRVQQYSIHGIYNTPRTVYQYNIRGLPTVQRSLYTYRIGSYN